MTLEKSMKLPRAGWEEPADKRKGVDTSYLRDIGYSILEQSNLELLLYKSAGGGPRRTLLAHERLLKNLWLSFRENKVKSSL